MRVGVFCCLIIKNWALYKVVWLQPKRSAVLTVLKDTNIYYVLSWLVHNRNRHSLLCPIGPAQLDRSSLWPYVDPGVYECGHREAEQESLDSFERQSTKATNQKEVRGGT